MREWRRCIQDQVRECDIGYSSQRVKCAGASSTQENNDCWQKIAPEDHKQHEIFAEASSTQTDRQVQHERLLRAWLIQINTLVPEEKAHSSHERIDCMGVRGATKLWREAWEVLKSLMTKIAHLFAYRKALINARIKLYAKKRYVCAEQHTWCSTLQSTFNSKKGCEHALTGLSTSLAVSRQSKRKKDRVHEGYLISFATLDISHRSESLEREN